MDQPTRDDDDIAASAEPQAGHARSMRRRIERDGLPTPAIRVAEPALVPFRDGRIPALPAQRASIPGAVTGTSARMGSSNASSWC
jgi:hypothetical protein